MTVSSPARRWVHALRSWRALLVLALKADRRRTLAVLLMAPVAGAAGAGYGLTLKWLLDAVIEGQTRAALAASAGLAVVAVGVGVLGTGVARLRLSLQQRIGHELDREVLLICSNQVDLADLEDPEFQDRMELLRRNRPTVVAAIGSVVENLRTSAQLVSVAALLASVDRWLLVLPLFAVPMVLATALGQRIQQRADLAAAEPGRRRRWLIELATDAAAAKELRIFGLTGEIAGRQRAAQRIVNDLTQRATVQAAALDLAAWLFFAVGFLGAIALLLHRVEDGSASPGDLVLLVTVAAQLDSAVTWAAQAAGWLRKASWATSHYLWLKDVTSATGSATRPKLAAVPPSGADLVLDSVSFRYPRSEQAVLQDVTLTIPAGSTVALVGENGAGKSTLAKLLCRLYEPTTGTIRLGQNSLADIDLRAWRGSVAVGFQDFCRYELTVRDAIGIGDLDHHHDTAAVLAAADRGGATELIEQLPAGLDTQLGRSFDAGTELSGGQWQALAVARTSMRQQPRLLLLDEPTASLDPMAEQALFDRYLRQGAAEPNQITVLISHRFGTVRGADLIVVLDGGRISEIGSHQELMQQQGNYAELFAMQAAGYRQTPVTDC